MILLIKVMKKFKLIKKKKYLKLKEYILHKINLCKNNKKVKLNLILKILLLQILKMMLE